MSAHTAQNDRSPIIILTGASRGLGLSTLQILLSRYNARVTTLSRSTPPDFQAVVEKYGDDRVLAIQGDVGDQATNAEVVKRTVEKWGGVDGLVLNAGGLEPLGRIADLDLSVLTTCSNTNLHSALYIIQPALPYLRKGRGADGAKGRIVLTSSGASMTGYVGWGLYCMAKSGLNALARVLANEEKEAGVAVWAVRPGVINTDMQSLLRDKGPGVMDPTQLQKFQDMYDNGQLLPPDEPGAVLAGLAVKGPIELTGEYIEWKDDRLSHLRL
ncbi:uncharacterized protein MKK02DRAFT_23892 [Dioszegia hungarica]|uniref:NAD(P)-binding protein n=1 Tax=Dioszegia hungarica TaxID=4972 RepID=A0AA38HC89_9TREE|nr:uncharacterized protein MKK02DRAFT_23892 [Dioszegia hungarica]KAI9637387.1 hypothetical protein MKK02DRAFT_23892 [Dioszegia hungarica]